jgi:oxysterol-binding protein-related protein 3/6/7
MPEDYELYYGFTRFAMELNELDLETAKFLPKTDTRFRPDQRYLTYLYILKELILL